MNVQNMLVNLVEPEGKWFYRVSGIAAFVLVVGYFLTFPIYGWVGDPPAASVEAQLAYFAEHAGGWWAIVFLMVFTDLLLVPIFFGIGKELLEGELFLRSAPSFLVWLLRWLFLEDVMTRYYDFRKVSIDLIANFYKEQRPELVPGLVDTVNGFFAAQIRDGGFKPLSMEEIKAYYREDAMIWRLYLAFRRTDRSLHTLLGKYYPYILPGYIER